MIYENIYKYTYKQEELEVLHKNMLDQQTMLNLTITIDPKKMSLVQAWEYARHPDTVIEDIQEVIPSNRWCGYVIATELHKNNTYPHFHAQMAVLGRLSNVQGHKLAREVSKYVYNMYGRSTCAINYTDKEFRPSFIPEHVHRDYSEYILKDVLTNQEIFKEDIPALHVSGSAFLVEPLSD